MDEPVEIPIEDSIDLHTFHPRDVRAVVEEYVFQARHKGFREVRLIHGRGVGVQRKIVQSFLRTHPDVVSFRDNDNRGSTLVTLKELP